MRRRVTVVAVVVALGVVSACSSSGPPTGRFHKTMEDSGQELWIDVGPSSIRSWEVNATASAADKSAAEAGGSVVAAVVDGDALVTAYQCEGATTIKGKARLRKTEAGVSWTLVSPPDVGGSWDCNGDFDTAFGEFVR